MISKVKFGEIYKGRIFSDFTTITFVSPENSKEKIKISSNDSFVFGRISGDGNSSFWYLLVQSFWNVAATENKLVIVLKKHKNIFSFTKEKLGSNFDRCSNRNNLLTVGKTFGVDQIFFKEEPVVEFITLKDINRLLDSTKYSTLVCSEVLFRKLFKEI